MIKKIIFLIAFYIIPVCSFSADLEVYLDSKSPVLGKSFMLTVELSNAKAVGDPDLGNFDDSLEIISQSKSRKTQIINGRMSSGTSWNYMIIAKKSGDFSIPPISVNSKHGRLFSKKLYFRVTERENIPDEQLTKNEDKITVTATVSNNNPYINESILYTLRIVTKDTINNVIIGDISVDGGIINIIGKPEIDTKYINGTQVSVIEAKYIFTALETKKVIIPPVVIKADIASSETQDPFQNNYMSPFSLFNNLTRFKTIAFSGNKVEIDIKSPEKGIEPWIPASYFKISAKWENTDNVKAGDPVILTLITAAQGITTEQLPSLDLKSRLKDSISVYNDKPVNNFTVNKNSIDSWREEKFTLIPKKSGVFTFPEIKVAWWDTKNKELKYEVIDKKEIEISPDTAMNNTEDNKLSEQSDAGVAGTDTEFNKKEDNISDNFKDKYKSLWLYLVIFFLIFVLCILIFIIFSMQKKISFLAVDGYKKREEDQGRKKYQDSKLKKLPLINEITDAAGIKLFLKDYAYKKYNISENENLESIFDMIVKNSEEAVKEKALDIRKKIEGAIYAGRDIDITYIKKELSYILNAEILKEKNKKAKKKKLPGLNPK